MKHEPTLFNKSGVLARYVGELAVHVIEENIHHNIRTAWLLL